MIAKIGQTLTIGAHPEHNARTYEFDVAKWRRMWPEATAINVIAQRPGDKTAYPAESSVDGDTVTWTVTRYDTDRPGAGKMRIAFVKGAELLGLTPETAIIVQEGMDMANGDTPASDTPPWIQQVLDAIANFTPGEGGGNGTPGKDGEDGATFYPSVSKDGELSWTNDKGLKNPEPVDIKGPKGSDANVTPQNIAAALGYTPAKQEDVTSLYQEIAGEEELQFIPVVLNVSTDGYYGKNGAFVSTVSNRGYASVDVSHGDKYRLSTVVGSTAIPAIVKYGSGGAFVGFEKAGTGNKEQVVDYEFVIEENVSRIVVQTAHENNQPKLALEKETVVQIMRRRSKRGEPDRNGKEAAPADRQGSAEPDGCGSGERAAAVRRVEAGHGV